MLREGVLSIVIRADFWDSRTKGRPDIRPPVKRPPGQKATGQKATASRGVFSGAYLNTFENGNFKLTCIRKNIHIYIHQKFFIQQAKHPCTRIWSPNTAFAADHTACAQRLWWNMSIKVLMICSSQYNIIIYPVISVIFLLCSNAMQCAE